ncbi:MAG: YqaJ viral recombinase family protein, partial [Gemmataceae bacterium]|nr:YqaJ viral recombinase family protein [Gemmataceae bacterium]
HYYNPIPFLQVDLDEAQEAALAEELQVEPVTERINHVMLETINSAPLMSVLDCFIDEYPDRDSWLEGRRFYVGASDTPGILDVGYSDQSIVTVYDSKINPPREVADPAKLRRFTIGRLIEPALRSIFAAESGQPCESAGEFSIYRHRDIPWLAATLDGLTVHDEYGVCPVELKNVSNFNKADWDGDEGPLKYTVQVQHQLAVTGASHGFLLGLIGGYEPVIKTIARNDRFIDAMLKRLEEFWGYVQRREMPPIDASAATGRILGLLYPKDTGSTVPLSEEAVRWDRELCESIEAIKKAEAVKLAAENKIKAAIKDASFGEITG